MGGDALGVGERGDKRGMLRLYLSDDGEHFYPATDVAGSGQDHCELINENFTPLEDGDDIRSGGCVECAMSRGVSIEGQPVFARESHGDRFDFIARSRARIYQSARLYCGPSRCDEEPLLNDEL